MASAFHSFEALLQSGTARTDGEDADEDLAGGAEDADEDFADGAEDADANDAPRRPTAASCAPPAARHCAASGCAWR